MGNTIAWALAFALIVDLRSASSEPAVSKAGLARQLLQGCLGMPTQESVSTLASAVAARPYSQVRVALGRSCRLSAPVADAQAMVELYEGLNPGPYGIRISADRRWIDFYSFDEDRFDVELSFDSRAPLTGLPPDPAGQEGHINLSDGDPRYLRGASPGIPTVDLTRAALLTGLAQTATMHLLNEQIEPVVQRLAAGR